MRAADVGWALRGEDRQVNELEARAAALLGKEAGLLVPTCSVANLVALMALAPRGGWVAADLTSHVATTEREGIERVAGLRFVDGEADVRVVENTHNNLGGVAFTAEETSRQIGAHRGPVHLDGARLWNAGVALGVPPTALAAPATTVAVSLDKGLGAPYGAILAGPREAIAEARRGAHRLGVASVHQAGLFAAAGLVALDGIDRLADDHRRAAALADGLARLPGLNVPMVEPRTNIVLVECRDLAADDLASRLAQRGVLALPRSERTVRFVTHRGIDDAAIATALRAAEAALG